MSRKEARRPGLVQAARGRAGSRNARGARAPGDEPAAVSAPQGPVSGRGGAGAWSTACRGRPSPQRLDVERPRPGRRRWSRRTYRDFNDCHATEKLREVEGLPVSRSTVRRLRRAPGAARPSGGAGPASTATRRTPDAARWAALVPRRRQPVRLARRPGPALTAASAPSTMRPAPSWPCTSGPPRICTAMLTLLARASARAPRPARWPSTAIASASSSATIAHWTPRGRTRRARKHPTHFGRILQDLGIGYIAAHSPQAKGRIERLWADPARPPRQPSCACAGSHTVEAAECLPAHLPRRPQPPLRAAAGRRGRLSFAKTVSDSLGVDPCSWDKPNTPGD